jgi:hypothetical protein
MGDHSHLSLGDPIRSLEGCSIGRILFDTENTLEVFDGLFSDEVRIFSFFQSGGKRVIWFARDGAGGTCNRIKATIRFSSRSALRIVEEGSTRIVSSRLIFDTVNRWALHPWKMVDEVDDSSSEVMMNNEVRLIILKGQCRTEYTGPSDWF